MMQTYLIVVGLLFFQQSPTISTYELAFANFGPLNTDIFIADVDGKNAKAFLLDPGLDYNASFSGDGTWVVFTSDRNDSSDIYRVHPDGNGLEQLTNDPSFDDQAVFSPLTTRQAIFVRHVYFPEHYLSLSVKEHNIHY